MLAEWVTVERFSEQTGIAQIEANKKCRSNEWPEAGNKAVDLFSGVK